MKLAVVGSRKIDSNFVYKYLSENIPDNVNEIVTGGAKGTDTFEYGSTKSHSYTRQVTTDTYKVSNATCTTKAVYKYCCATCDKAGATTYEHGSTLSHSYSKR